MLAMPFRFILPVFVVDIYRQGPDSMGLLVGLMGMGSMFSSLYVASMGQELISDVVEIEKAQVTERA